jgi:hypothetical protein
MLMKKFLRRKIIAIPLLGIGLLLSGQIALADPIFQDNLYQKCDEGIYPFLPNATPGQISTSDNDVNHSSESECSSHLVGTFPNNQHVQPPQQVNHVPLKTTQRSVPRATHEHHYINESNSNDGFYKRAWLRKFEIILQPDFKQTLKPGSLLCPIPNDGNPANFDLGFASCNHTNNNVFGGTKVEFDGTTIRYTFGLFQPQNGYKPVLPGINPDIDQGIFFPKDTTLAQNRMFSMSIDFETKDLSSLQKLWTATTTSRAEVIHTAIPKDKFSTGKMHSCTDGGPWNASNSWCNVGGYKWVNIGSDISLWQVPTPPPSLNKCVDLIVTPNTLQPNTPVTFHVEPKFQFAPPPAYGTPDYYFDYRWTASPVVYLPAPPPPSNIDYGKFADHSQATAFSNPFLDRDQELIPGDDKDTYYTGGPGGTFIYVEALDQNGNKVPGCDGSLFIGAPPEVQKCLGLEITNPDAQDGVLEFTEGQPFAYKFNVQAQTEGGLQLHYKWTDQPATGTFDGFPGPYTDPNTGTAYVNNNPQDGAKIEVQAVDPTSGKAYQQCTDNVILKKVGIPGAVCKDLTLNSSNGSPLNENQPSVLTASGVKTDNTPVTVLNWTTTAGILVPQGACTGQLPSQNLTLDASCPVLFTGGPEGTNVTVSSVPPEPSGECRETLTVVKPPQVCQNLNLVPQGNNQYCAETVPPEYANQVVWSFPGSFNLYNNNRCITLNNIPPNATLQASVPNTACQDSLSFPPPPPPKKPPTVEKDARILTQTGYSKVISISNTGKIEIEYRIRFTPGSSDPVSATLLDTISNGGYIQGQYPQKFEHLPGTPPVPGRIEYRDSMVVTGVNQCTGDLTNASNCYTGEIVSGLQLIKVTNPVTITYKGEVVNSAITEPNCNLGVVCQENYENKVEVDYQFPSLPTQPGGSGHITSNLVRLQIFCQYVLSRAAGDIFLETDLQTGIDIYKCTKYKTTTGVVISPRPVVVQEVIKVGQGDTQIVSIGHEVCDQGQAGNLTGELKETFGDTSKLSSQICELKLRAGASWDKTAVTNSIDENKTRIARWEPNLSPGTVLNKAPQDQTQVYRVKGGDLIIDNTSQYFLEDGKGAKTFIVEDGDLIIRDNIKYGACQTGNCNLRQTASLAFIVLNGNVYVDPNVTDLAGIYFVQQGSQGNGKLFSGTGPGNAKAVSNKSLNVLGSIFGDFEPLLQSRKAAGDPGKDEGSLVVRFDQRIIINTPPGLQDLVDIQESEVAR